MRDGREAMLSYYHMLKNMGNEVSMNDLYNEEFLPINFKWFEHILSWKKNEFGSVILLLKYEDLVTDKLGCLHKTCVFLNLERPQEDLINDVEFTFFDRMNKMESKTDWVTIKKKVFLPGKKLFKKRLRLA
jgi:hypothetical protein